MDRVKGYGEAFAEEDYVTVCFDFCGGGWASRNGGALLDMSVLTEKADLEAVLEEVKQWDFVYIGSIYLMGNSQGGLVTALAAAALFLFAWYFTWKLLRPLEESQRRQTQFVAAASHELRTPLAVILSCASASRCGNEEERAHFLDSIQSEGMRMSGLIDDMLLLSGMEAHTWSVEMRPTELDTLLLEAFEAFEPVAAEKPVRLAIELPQEALPPCSCDPGRIRQVLSILLHNAVSYTPAQGLIRLSLENKKKTFRIQVADNGIGIPEEEKSRIFERFYRADPSRSRKGHFGLGLAIASEIIKAHQGQILVGDTPGGGSTFTIVL